MHKHTRTNACTHAHTTLSQEYIIQPATNRGKLHSKRFESDLASRGTEGAIRRDSDTVEEGCVAIVVGLQPTVGQVPHLYVPQSNSESVCNATVKCGPQK